MAYCYAELITKSIARNLIRNGLRKFAEEAANRAALPKPPPYARGLV